MGKRLSTQPKDAAQKGWHPEDIKAAIRKRGITMSELSRRHGYSDGSARGVLYRPWPLMEKIIADFIGEHPATLWPDRYDETGRSTRRPRGRQRKDTSSVTNLHRKRGVA